MLLTRPPHGYTHVDDCLSSITIVNICCRKSTLVFAGSPVSNLLTHICRYLHRLGGLAQGYAEDKHESQHSRVEQSSAPPRVPQVLTEQMVRDSWVKTFPDPPRDSHKFARFRCPIPAPAHSSPQKTVSPGDMYLEHLIPTRHTFVEDVAQRTVSLGDKVTENRSVYDLQSILCVLGANSSSGHDHDYLLLGHYYYLKMGQLVWEKISQMRYRADESDSSMHSIEHVAYFYTAHQYDNQPMYHLFQTMNDNINHLTYVIALSLLIQNSLKEQDGFFHNIHPSAMYSMGSGTCSQLVKI